MNSKDSSTIHLFLTRENITESQVNELDQLTKEMGQTLDEYTDAVETISIVGREALPQGTKVAELLFAQQAVIQIIPIIAPWVLSKIDSIIKSLANRGERVNANIQVSNHAFQITPETTKSNLANFEQKIEAVNKLSPGKRFALIVGNSDYSDSRLTNLKSSIVDVERFAEILAKPQIGGFTDVKTLKNASNDVIEQNIERFFLNKDREDQLLLYFSGHGIRSSSGQLYLAAQNTKYDLLRSTGVSSDFIKESMDESHSQRQILMLDCCYGGAIVEGAKSDHVIGQTADSISAFSTSGFGRVIITASDSMQYAFDGNTVEDFTENSAFTHHLIEGLRTGEADSDNDGLINIDEIYQFVHRKVYPKQNPSISKKAQEGQLFIGLNPNPSVKPAQLPEQLRRSMESDNRVNRQGAVSELERLLNDPNLATALAAEIALQNMTKDDSRIVAELAQEALNPQVSSEYVQQPKSIVAPAQTSEPIIQPQPALSPKPTPAENVAPVPTRTDTVLPDDQPSRQLVQKPKNEVLGGCINVIIPGFCYAYIGNWKRAIGTFFAMVAVFLISIIVAANIYPPLIFILIIGMAIYLFFSGKKVVQMENEKQMLGKGAE